MTLLPGIFQSVSPQRPYYPRFEAKKAPQPRFAGVSDILPYADVFEGQSQLTGYGGKDHRDTETAYNLLPAEGQTLVDQLAQKVSPDDLQAYFDSGKLGILEEYADMLYEYYSLRVLQEGIVSEEKLALIGEKIIRPGMDENKLFKEVFEEVRKGFSSDQMKEFKALAQISDTQQAETLLTIICFKYAIFMARGKNNKILPLTQNRLVGEAEELGNHLASEAPYIASQLVNHTRTHVSARTVKDGSFHELPEALVQYRFGLEKPFPREEALRFVAAKLLGRQQLDYAQGCKPNPSERLKYKERKDVLKRFEALLEATVLRENGLAPSDPVYLFSEIDDYEQARLGGGFSAELLFKDPA